MGYKVVLAVRTSKLKAQDFATNLKITIVLHAHKTKLMLKGADKN